MTEETEKALLGRVARGDTVAFDVFCRQLERPLYAYALGLVKEHAEAEDIAQEALFRLYRMARSGEIRSRRGSPRALVFAIAHNLAMDVHRRARNVVVLEPQVPRATSTHAERALLREQIEHALALLPGSHREALLLREFGELSYAEIARTLDSTIDSVKIWLYRARHRLAELLDQDGQCVREESHLRKGEESHEM